MLSAREREVLRLVATGHVAEEIALQLTISAQTANSHVKNTYRKPFSRHAAPIIRTSNESGAGLHRQQAWQRLISEDPVVALCRALGRKLLRQHKVLAGGLESGQPMAVLLGNFIHGVVVSQRPGHPRFAVVGHDRGAYVAFRAAMDHPEAVSRLVVLDAVPIVEALERCNARFAQWWWHWFFYAQSDKPERAILADPEAWYGGSPEHMGAEAFEDFRQAIHDPDTVHAMVEDYRAGLGIDRTHDEEDRRHGRKVRCPMLCMWSKRDDLEALYGDVLGVWAPWAGDLQGGALNCGHHMAEEKPEELAARLLDFLRR